MAVLLPIYALVSVLLAACIAYSFLDARMMDPYAIEDATEEDWLLLVIASSVFLLYVAERVLLVICAFTVGRFTYRAMRNLYTVRSAVPDMSPASTVYWYFVPFANFIMPANAMSEIHHGSIAETGSLNTSSLVSWWWSAWLAFNILSSVSNLMSDQFMFSLTTSVIATLSGGAAALLLARLVRRIRTAQDQFTHGNLADTFT
ncbi:hypothetical protein HJO_11122 [Hyphomonas johnsonii MHS-2]|uniref:DUF4328 domain-containing protein n=1 Tax=Hyphomonas johnsonii MHS-2 TaxID=1280950 RepID=A0A059FLY5_9PROT|nr:hypothetical protein HJO_11122 [Hyphomonas johnsonii MHS-2]